LMADEAERGAEPEAVAEVAAKLVAAIRRGIDDR
jgi:hypothetical protein